MELVSSGKLKLPTKVGNPTREASILCKVATEQAYLPRPREGIILQLIFFSPCV